MSPCAAEIRDDAAAVCGPPISVRTIFGPSDLVVVS